MPELVAYLVLFLLVGVGFILVHLLIGKLIRPARPHREKLTIYECGEPTIGSAWVQFDVRFYVVALLFVIFDVEVAFFFPWAVVFGKTTDLGKDNTTADQRIALTVGSEQETTPLVPDYKENKVARAEFRAAVKNEEQSANKPVTADNRRAAQQFARIAFVDILIFFGVLLVGFAYLWRRGDLQWVRSVEAEKASAVPEPAPLVGV